MSHTQEIIINNLKIHSNRRDVSDVVFRLESQSWHGYVDNNKWLFVRHLTACGNKNELTQKVGSELQNAIKIAVDGGSSQAINANAVCFHSLPELLAFLLRDLMDGTLLQKWYWHNWHYLFNETKTNAVARILWDNVNYLPTIVQCLMRYQLLSKVWENLTHQSAGEIIKRLDGALPTPYVPMVALVSDSNESRVNLEKIIIKQLDLITPLLQKWFTALDGISVLDNRIKLAFTLIAKDNFPRLWFKHASTVESLMGKKILQNLVSHKREKENSQPQVNGTLENIPYSFKKQESRCNVIRDFKRHLLRQKNKKLYAYSVEGLYKDCSQQHENPVVSGQDNYLFKGDQKGVDTKSTGKIIDSNLASNEIEVTNSQDNLISPNSNIENQLTPFFYTEHGGVFYLINLLANNRYQQLLQQDDVDRSGWLWLFDLARRLSASLDHAILNFIVEQSDYKQIDELLKMPLLPVINKIEPLLSTDLSEKKLWDHNLLAVPVKVVVTASHIDCYYSLDSVRLEVRLAGLDINPGWVPWLGKVIIFHYD